MRVTISARRRLWPILALVLMSIVSARAEGLPGRPAMFRADPALTGVYPGPTPASLRGLLFSFRAAGPIRSSPAVADGTLFFGSVDGIFYALDARTGAVRWTRPVGSSVTSSPAVTGGRVFLTTRAAILLALDVRSGATRWRLDLGRDLGGQNYWDFYTSSPTLADGKLYVGTGSGNVLAVDPANGRVLWRASLGARVRSTPAISGNYVVVGTMAGNVVALDRQTGARLWSFATEGASHDFALHNNDTTSIFSSASIAGNIVTIGARDGFLYGLDLATGRQVWRTTHDGSSWILSTANDGDSVYVGSGSAFIVQRADRSDGHENWRFATGAANFGSVIVAGDMVLFNDFNGTLYAVAKADGREAWRFSLGDRAFSTPVVADNIVYASSDEGVLVALETSPEAVPADRAMRRLVYFEGPRSATAFSWFQNGVDTAILAYFKGAGYEQVDAAGLAQAMRDEIAGRRHSVLVFADNRIPATSLEGEPGNRLLRQFLDAGGNVVLLGSNAIALVTDPATGELTGQDLSPVETTLGVHLPPRTVDWGYHVSRFNAEAERWGLSGDFVTSGTIGADQVDVVLATNEFGMSTSWVKSFGPRHGLLLQFAIPRARNVDLTPYRLAIEHSLLWDEMRR
jgi:outer membrane protein assembly factor BamB